MENKKLYIGLGVLAVAGIGYYMWKKNKDEKKSSASGVLRSGGKLPVKSNPIQEITYVWECINPNGTVAQSGFGSNSTGGCPIGTTRKDIKQV